MKGAGKDNISEDEYHREKSKVVRSSQEKGRRYCLKNNFKCYGSRKETGMKAEKGGKALVKGIWKVSS